nr:hypothetical protein [Aneurinibacillus terranovensis]
MGRGRKSNYINKLTNKDQNFLKALRNVGYLNQNHIKEHIGLTDKRVVNYERDGLIERCAYLNRETKEMEHIWRLTDKGRDLTSTQMNLDNFYKSSSARHDLGLADKYFSLSQSDRDHWLTEADLRDRLYEQIENLQEQREIARAEELREMLQERMISPPDGGCMRGEHMVTFEIITSSYGPAELAAKDEYVQEMGVQYETIKI